MQGYQPFYTGTVLTQAARSAGEFQMQGARAMADGMGKLGEGLGIAAGVAANYYMGRPSTNEIKQADPTNKIFGAGERPSLGKFQRRTQAYQADRATKIQEDNAFVGLLDATSRLDQNRNALLLRKLGLSTIVDDDQRVDFDLRYPSGLPTSLSQQLGSSYQITDIRLPSGGF